MKKKISFHIGYPDKEENAPVKIYLGVPLRGSSEDRKLGYKKVLLRSILLFLLCVAAAVIATILLT